MWQSLQHFVATRRVEIALGTATSLLAAFIISILGVPRRIIQKFAHRGANRPVTNTLILLRDIYGVKSGWVFSTTATSKAMVSGSYLVTNRTDEPIIIARAQAKIGRVVEDAAFVQFVSQVAPKGTARIAVTFFCTPRRLHAGKELVADIGRIDQLGNAHWLRKERFRFLDSLTE